MARVLVIGASSGIGLETIKRAAEAGHEVRAMARSASRMSIRHERLEPVDGDARDALDVRRALEGIDVVIQTLGVKPSLARILCRSRFFADTTRTLVRCMDEVGTRRLLCVTGFGAGDSRNQSGPLFNAAFNAALGRVYDDKSVQEHVIRNSELDWMIARPVILTNARARGRYEAILDPSMWRPGLIARGDVADFLVRQIEDDDFLRKTPMLRGTMCAPVRTPASAM